MEKVLNQHGDLLLKEVSEIPQGAKRIKVKIGQKFVIEKGEGGHTHTLEIVEGMEIYEHEGTIFIKQSNKPSKLDHEEHKNQVVVPDKIIKKDIEQEFDYESMEARKTQD